MGDQLKNVIIGVFVLAALVIVVFILLFLHPTTGDEGQIIHVRFTDIDKVNVGTPVTFAGRPVGEVSNIRTLNPGREGGPTDDYGRLYVYELSLLIDSRVRVYDTDAIALRTAGLLGERSISIMPMAPPKGVTPKLVTKDDILYAIESGSVEDAVREFKQLSDQAEIVIGQFSNMLKEIEKEEVVKYFGSAIRNVSDITGALNKPEEWSNILTNFDQISNDVSTRLPKSWDILDETLVNAKTFTREFRDVSSTTRTILYDFEQGRGSLGALLRNEDLYLNLKSILNKIETVADDVNHYGLFFQTDKGWQRLRARRMNLLQKLSSPQEFRNYFNDEINQITTSLARVNMVLERTDSCWPYGTCYSLIEDENFTKVFAELIRRVENMEESLNMYNQQLVDIQVQETELSPCCCE